MSQYVGDPRRAKSVWAVIAVATAITLGFSVSDPISDAARGASPPVTPSCAPAPAPLTFTSATPTTIPDVGSATSQIALTPGLMGIWDLDVRTNIRHPAPGSLTIELVAPFGQRTTLSSGNGGDAADAFNGTLWDDSADPNGQVPYSANDNLVTDHAYSSGVVASPLAPEEALASGGLSASGVWSLVVTDNAPGGQGTLDGWALLVTPRSPFALFGPPSSSVLTLTSPGPSAIDSGASTTTVSTIVVPPQSATNHLPAAPELTTNIAHAQSGDLDVTLTSPAGTVVTLTTDNATGIADAFTATTWTDLGAGPVSDLTTFAGPIKPEEPLRAFVGENPVGTWTLTVHDDTVGNGGSLIGWSLAIAPQACTPSVGIALRSDPNPTAGAPMAFDVTATVLPTIGAQDLSVRVDLLRGLRFVRLSPPVGAACTAPPRGSIEGQVRCVWPGPTVVGQQRTFRVVVNPVAAVKHRVFFDVSTGIMARGAPIFVPPAEITIGPSRLRAVTGQRCGIVGTPGDDVLRVSDFRRGGAVVCGLGGDDRLTGGQRRDVIDAGPGDDVVAGGDGPDLLLGGPGRDRVSGGNGNDVLRGGPNADSLRGGLGRDIGVDVEGDAVRGIEVRR